MLPIACANAPTARVVAPYAQTLWDAACAEGVSPSLLATAAGVPQLGEDELPVSAYLAMLATVVAHTDSLFGWRLGQQVKPTTYGVNGILLLACPTLGAALEQVLRFEALVHDLGRSTLVRQGDTVQYGWRNDWATHPAAGALTESVFAGIQTCAEWLAGRRLEGFGLHFCHTRAEAERQRIETLARSPVRYGAEANLAIFPSDWLTLPIPQAQNGLLPMLQQHAESLLQARHAASEPPLVGQVRQAILTHLGEGGVTLRAVADALMLSTRTLQRRLGELNLTFQTVLDHTRHDLARHYLRQSAMPIGEIGYLLGFHDPAAFHHAFKSWEGVGPGVFRAG